MSYGMSASYIDLSPRLPSHVDGVGATAGVKMLDRLQVLSPRAFISLVQEGICHLKWGGRDYMFLLRTADHSTGNTALSLEVLDYKETKRVVAGLDFVIDEASKYAYGGSSHFEPLPLSLSAQVEIEKVLNYSQRQRLTVEELTSSHPGLYFDRNLFPVNKAPRIEVLLVGVASLIAQMHKARFLMIDQLVPSDMRENQRRSILREYAEMFGGEVTGRINAEVTVRLNQPVS